MDPCNLIENDKSPRVHHITAMSALLNTIPFVLQCSIQDFDGDPTHHCMIQPNVHFKGLIPEAHNVNSCHRSCDFLLDQARE